MPMTLHGLQEVGLMDWPAWYRSLNPSYFVSETQGFKAGIGGARIGRREGRGCSLQAIGVATNAKINAGKPEKLRGGSRTIVRERSMGRVLRSEELGEQIIARLKSMEKEGKGQVGEKGVSASLLIERASARDTKNWEDESESDEEDEGEEDSEEVKTQGKLVDV